MENYKAQKITIIGRVQGVGFRPFVFSLANKFSINGTVQNNMDGVKIFVEGHSTSLATFVEAIKSQLPRLAIINKLEVEEGIPIQNYSSFSIIESDRGGKSSLVIPIDASICPECTAEMNDPKNSRYQYPFINCTQCGPRYTIIKELPYDRQFTTMNKFKMCDRCRSEYEDPVNRRHHAQPIACPDCGPTVRLYSINGEELKQGNEAIEVTKRLLKSGKIIAIKGLGGYHLACNAYDETAVKQLRQRKNRPTRPLAIMAAEIATIQKFAMIDEKEKAVLHSPEAPIVIVKKQENLLLTEELIAPGMKTIGVFLPYTPLHKLIFTNNYLELIVMTSANRSGMPMLYKDDEVFTKLEGIADYVLMSNREIEHPIDDSVVQIVDGEVHLFRRARGYVPDPLFTKESVDGIIALGSQQKNTFAIGRSDQIFIGPHIGDMGSEEVTNHFLNELNHLSKWLGVRAGTLAIDKHPQYETGRLANEIESKNIVRVQHHHAHHVACMEDNQLYEPCFGLILDGTGYGEDGNVWGFELLYGDSISYKRLGHLSYYPLPGGEKAVKEPWRNAVSMMITQFGESEGQKFATALFPDKITEINIIKNMIEKKINSPLAGTCGRLFDAVSAIAGVCKRSTYDGEAAIRLSELTSEAEGSSDFYPFEIVKKEGLNELLMREGLKKLINEVLSGVSQKTIALKFHETVVQMCLGLVIEATKAKPLLNKKIVLSGGSFHNRYLLHHLKKRLYEEGFQVYTHKNIPCNDGGISLGQVMIANKQRIEI